MKSLQATYSKAWTFSKIGLKPTNSLANKCRSQVTKGNRTILDRTILEYGLQFYYGMVRIEQTPLQINLDLKLQKSNQNANKCRSQFTKVKTTKSLANKFRSRVTKRNRTILEYGRQFYDGMVRIEQIHLQINVDLKLQKSSQQTSLQINVDLRAGILLRPDGGLKVTKGNRTILEYGRQFYYGMIRNQKNSPANKCRSGVTKD